jgi:TolB-like protein/Tfp pilus assembly protein PilF
MKQNEEVTLPPKAFDTLLELVKLKGRVLEREALMRKVWPDTFVEEGNVKVIIFNLRKAIEDNPSEPRFIQTVARRGYRFGVDVIEIEDPPRWGQEIAGQAGIDLNIKSIAVLPFKLLGGVEEEYLGVGLADALIIKLSGLSNIIVRPTSAVRRYIGSDERPDEIARQLNVEAILEGNIYSAGNRVRVTAQLINVKGVTPLWAGKFDERFTDIFDVEDSISEQVAQALMLKLTGHDRQRLTTHYTENIKAYQFYLKGRYHWAKRLSAGTRLAAEHFRAAIDLDPNYSLAYAGLADCYTQLAWLRLLAPCEALPLAKAAALRALELDPLLGEAYASLAWIRLLYDLDYEAAENEFRHSLELKPNYSVARMWFGMFLLAVGRFTEALEEVNKALTLDPLSPIINAVAGWPFYFMRDYQRAIECYRKAIELEPKSLPAHYLLALSYLQFGEPEHAVAEMQIARTLDDSSMTVAGLAEAYSGAGEITKATELLEELNRMAGEEGKYVSPYDEAAVYLRLGSPDRAMGLLEKAFEDQSTWRMLLPVDPKFDQLRHDVRFGVLLKRMGMKN